MQGQWIGIFKGTNEGKAFLNLEEINNEYSGPLIIIEDNPEFPCFTMNCNVELEGKNIKGKATGCVVINPINWVQDENLKIDHFYPGKVVPEFILFQGEIKNNIIMFDWETSLETKGTAGLERSDLTARSKYPTKKMSWKMYKDYIIKMPNKGDYIFRGQKENWKLRTSFHRTGRCNLVRYSFQDVHKLHRYISANVKHFFKIEDPKEHGALLSLAQHHGYPTPLIDWTDSPFIAAYFAFEDVNKFDTKGNVRIFLFNKKKWAEKHQRIDNIIAALPTMNIYEFLAIENRRMLPQQSITLFSNIDDIEKFIIAREKSYNENYLEIIEIPRNEREYVMDDLYYMGITAGTLFPGLDGICKELKERYF